MLSRVAQHVAVPIHLFIAKRELSHTVGAAVPKPRLRTIQNLHPRLAQTLAEIHIFKPHGKELLVEATELVPHCPTDSQARSRRLFHFLLLRVVSVQTSIPPVHRIARPQLINQQRLANQRRKRCYSTEGKTARRLTACF